MASAPFAYPLSKWSAGFIRVPCSFPGPGFSFQLWLYFKCSQHVPWCFFVGGAGLAIPRGGWTHRLMLGSVTGVSHSDVCRRHPGLEEASGAPPSCQEVEMELQASISPHHLSSPEVQEAQWHPGWWPCAWDGDYGCCGPCCLGGTGWQHREMLVSSSAPAVRGQCLGPNRHQELSFAIMQTLWGILEIAPGCLMENNSLRWG